MSESTLVFVLFGLNVFQVLMLAGVMLALSKHGIIGEAVLELKERNQLTPRTGHTELPWCVVDCRKHGEDRISIASLPAWKAGKPPIIARIENTVSGRPLDDGDLANARLIVDAANKVFGGVNE